MGNDSDYNQNTQQFGQINTNVDPMSHLRSRPNFPKSTDGPYISPEANRPLPLPFSLFVTIVILASIFFGGLGFILGKFVLKDNVACEPSVEISENAVDMPKDYKEVNDTFLGITDKFDTIASRLFMNTSARPHLKPEGLNVFVPTRFSISVNYKNENLTKELIKDEFGKLGFKLNPDSQTFADLDLINNEKNVLCEISGLSTAEMTISCAKTSWHWLTDDERNLIKDLETAYHNKVGLYPKIIDLGVDHRIVSGMLAPSKILEVDLGEGMGLFYRANSDSEWKFVTTTKEGKVSCESFEDEDSRKAYRGRICLNADGTEATVQPSPL